jgi:NTF2-like protein (DUF6841)
MQSPLDFIHRYYSEFSALDLQTIAGYFSEPCMSIGRGRVFVAGNRVQFIDATTPLIEALRAKEYGHSEFANAETVMLNDNAALVRGVAVRYARSGLEIERVPISYLVHSNGADWRIAVMVFLD